MKEKDRERIEKMILVDIANGVERTETAQKVNKTVRTVERRIEILRARMGAKTTAHLIHLAHVNKLLS